MSQYPTEATTSWTLVRKVAGHEDATDFNAAWRELIERYERVIKATARAYLARCGLASEATTIVNDFFADLYKKQTLAKADPERGRFRQYIIGVLKNHLHGAVRSIRRRPEVGLETLDLKTPDEVDLGREDEASWAAGLLRNGCDSLEAELAPRGKEEYLEILLRVYGVGKYKQCTIADIATETGRSRNPIDRILTDMRKRLRFHVEREIALTIDQAVVDFAEEKAFIIHRILRAHPGVLDEPESRSGPDGNTAWASA